MSEIARRCLEEIKKRMGRERELEGWEKERKEFYVENKI